MRILKSQAFLRLVNSYLVDSPQPANISYLWNFGSLLGTCLVLQILTGVFLAMHYTPHVDFAFNSVEHIMRDVNAGYILRYTHANVASFFFIFVYAHIARGLYYSSYKAPRALVWNIGVIIFIVMMATAFLGYKHSPKWSKFNNKKLKTFYTSCNRYSSPVKLSYLKYSTQVINLANKNDSQSLIIANFIKDKNLTPAYVFENLHLDETKKEILNNTKENSGIYLILNKITLDYYIGSASTGKFFPRICYI